MMNLSDVGFKEWAEWDNLKNTNLVLPQSLFGNMACGHQRRGASPTPDQEGINSNTLLDHPAAPDEKC
ncbi:hypothetical protein ACRWQM_13960 [Shewanella sp. HL-SH5]|uniref:hypothetical protein n=1 Tax=Shewanella sp. HL-SH5 TaxID=3436241 RepID=UPI003EBBB44B